MILQKLVKVVTTGAESSGEWTVVVLAGHSLQRWQLSTGEMEVLLFEADLARPLREAFLQADHVSNICYELNLLEIKNHYINLETSVTILM